MHNADGAELERAPVTEALSPGLDLANSIWIFFGPLFWIALATTTFVSAGLHRFDLNRPIVLAPSFSSVRGLSACALWLSATINIVAVVVNNIFGFVGSGGGADGLGTTLWLSGYADIYVGTMDVLTILLLALFVAIARSVDRERWSPESQIGFELPIAYGLTILGSVLLLVSVSSTALQFMSGMVG